MTIISYPKLINELEKNIIKKNELEKNERHMTLLFFYFLSRISYERLITFNLIIHKEESHL